MSRCEKCGLEAERFVSKEMNVYMVVGKESKYAALLCFKCLDDWTACYKHHELNKRWEQLQVRKYAFEQVAKHATVNISTGEEIMTEYLSLCWELRDLFFAWLDKTEDE
jgi:hypothetical protein